MNTKEYIESGIIENYILGNVSAQEKQEVECMTHIYPEIREELKRSEAALEAYAQRFSTKTPEGLKQTILAEIEKDSEKPGTEAKLIQLPGKEKINPFWKYAAAAGFLFFLISSTFLILQKNKNKELTGELAGMQQKTNDMSLDMNKQNKRLDFYTNPENRIVAMKGLEKKDPSSLALICWNTVSKEVYIDVKKLPAAPAGKQYQLWAIVDGKPVDLGVMSADDGGDAFHKMKTVAAAQAFAVTLEKTGGSPVPTMEEMYVIGNV